MLPHKGNPADAQRDPTLVRSSLPPQGLDFWLKSLGVVKPAAETTPRLCPYQALLGHRTEDISC